MRLNIDIARVKRGSMVDGPDGPRTVVWLQGCSIRCIGCQNWALWPKETTDMLSLEPAEAAAMVLSIANGQPITITGGEPFDQAEALGPFVTALKKLGGRSPHIIIYTGYRYEDVLPFAGWTQANTSQKKIGTFMALEKADVLVDGEYIARMDTPSMQWRGSQNQRPIDLAATRGWIAEQGAGAWNIPVLLDWDTPTLEIVGGTVYATGGLLAKLDLEQFGVVEAIPRCGEFEED